VTGSFGSGDFGKFNGWNFEGNFVKSGPKSHVQYFLSGKIE